MEITLTLTPSTDDFSFLHYRLSLSLSADGIRPCHPVLFISRLSSERLVVVQSFQELGCCVKSAHGAAATGADRLEQTDTLD